MTSWRFVQFVALTAAFLATLDCGGPSAGPRTPTDTPNKIIWAWERQEDLAQLDPSKFGVAFLAQTLTLEGPSVNFRPRRQPLTAAAGAYLIAVTRVETRRADSEKPEYSDDQIRKLVGLTVESLKLPGVKGIQIDFDAVLSERPFYGKFIRSLRAGLPAGTPLTVTALASWCIGDKWLEELPIDEAVPMVFEMGSDSERVRSFLRNGNDWTSPICRGSYGLSVDDPVGGGIISGRRVYYFKNSKWNAEDLGRLQRAAD